MDLARHPPAPPTPVSDAGCAECHEVAATLAGSAHAALGCGDCHGPAHAIRPASDPASRVFSVVQLETCGTCHDPELVARYREGVHGHGLLAAGLPVAASCSDCHGDHGILPPDDPASSLSWHRTPETCGSCHSLLLPVWTGESAHGMAWKRGEKGGPVCTTCHASHGVERPTLAHARLRFPEECGGCHGEAYSTYRDSFHGKFTSLGFLTAATCSDCHTPHRNLPETDPRSTVHASHRLATCRQCHPGASPRLASFDPHSDPSHPTRNPAVHTAWLFMTGLMVAVFGFFAVHDLLWLQRSVVGALRAEFPPRASPDGPWVRRFSRAQTWMHVVVVTTFLLLAATGLPLKFHQYPWAHVLAALFGGVGVTARLHGLAGAATFAYFLAHLGQLVYLRWGRHEQGLFWGWRSMVPQPRDLVELWGHVRYFLYLGPRPAFDRWTYWEKFDYFAVFWGVVIIGLSGIMLAFPVFATHLLPGWILNAAFVVHSEEALLAVGFIFVFHFFHTHLRPESFPLDPVIFVGCMPLERFRHERPREYERLRAAGALEGRLVARPTETGMRVARAFGFSALTVGLLLALAILAGFARRLIAP